MAKFVSDREIVVEGSQGKKTIQFENAIIAAGSRPVKLPFLPDDPRIIDSTGALELANTDGSMLVIGGGIIGLEMATVYHALGTEISIVEWMDQVIPGADKDVVLPLQKRIQKRYKNIYLKTKVTQVEAKKDGLWVTFEGENAPDKPQRFDRILCAVGRRPNGDQMMLRKLASKWMKKDLLQLISNCVPMYRTFLLSAIFAVILCWRIKRCLKDALQQK